MQEQEKMKQFSKNVTLSHFSHHHPLLLSNVHPAGEAACYACKQNVLPGKDYYCCKTCPFVLHQVCYNMPRKRQHPGHPNHNLNLLVMPPSTKETFHCKACGNEISGFYYSCEKCSICYHILCSSLPLSVAITSHSHTVKLEFSPPYDFECDLCQKPCYNGWLYRCQFCEFDTHLACAISDQRKEFGKHVSALVPDNRTRPVTYSSPTLMETNRKMEYGSEGTELMKLIEQGVARSNMESSNQKVAHRAVVGWDERLNSPMAKSSIRNGSKIGGTRSGQSTPGASPNLGHIQAAGRSGLLSGDTSTITTPSYRFSESCFSIDLANSYSSHGHANQGSKEDSYHESKVFPEVKGTIRYHHNVRNVDGSKEARQELPYFNKIGQGMHYAGLEKRMNEALLVGGGATSSGKGLDQRNKKKDANESRVRTSIRDQNTISDAGRSGCAGLWKLLGNCYYPKK